MRTSNAQPYFPIFFFLLASLCLGRPVTVYGLPDLEVTALNTNSQCQMMITIENNGPSPLPESAYDPITGAFLRFEVNGQFLDAFRLNFLDPDKRLLKPNSTLTWTHGSLVIQTSTNYSVHVDPESAVTEANESNNTRTAIWPDLPNCSPSATTDLPDLEITQMYFDHACRVTITIRNNGPAPVPDSAYDLLLGSSVRYFTNTENLNQTMLSIIDPNRILKTPGASVTWVNNYFNFPGSDLVFVWVDSVQNIYETNESNNMSSRWHAADSSCRPDLRVSDLHLDEQCRLVVTLENVGGWRIPSEAWHPTDGVVVKMEKGGQNWLGFYLYNVDPGAHLAAPGNAIQVIYLTMGDDTSEAIRAIVDWTDVVLEKSEYNNAMSKTLTCGPDGTPVDTEPTGSGLLLRAIEIDLDDIMTPRDLQRLQKTVSHQKTKATRKAPMEKPGLSAEPEKSRQSVAHSATKSDPKHKAPGKKRLPDLSIVDLKVNPLGQLVVILKNKGHGPLSEEDYKSRESWLELKQNKKPVRQWNLRQVDPAKQLRNPGGTLIWTVPTIRLKSPETIQVDINKQGEIKEASLSDNSMKKNLSPLPGKKIIRTIPEVAPDKTKVSSGVEGVKTQTRK